MLAIIFVFPFPAGSRDRLLLCLFAFDMAQVTRQQRGKQAGASAATRGGQISKQRKKQKVILERDQEDKKLRTVVRRYHRTARGRAHPYPQVSFRADPPQGYTFIPLGNPQLTNALKKAAVESNQKVHIVSVRSAWA